MKVLTDKDGGDDNMAFGDTKMTLEEALIELAKEPVLIEDGSDNWQPSNLLDELDEEWRNKEVYACNTYIADIDDDGYQVTPARYAVVNIGETPYFVQPRDDGSYEVRLMERPASEYSRKIYGQSIYKQKQSAYRRKSQLNEDWQKNRSLGA